MKKPRIILYSLAALAVLSCSRKKDSFTSRTYHNMTSQFNPLFNGEQAYIKGVETIERSHKNQYETFISVYKWGDEESAQTIYADMDRAIEKGSKVIREHSMVIGGKQKNSSIVEAYLLVGNARFYKRDLFPALETYNYVIQEFPKTDESYAAYIKSGQTQYLIGNYEGALIVLDEVYNNRRVPEEMRPDVDATRAMALIKKQEYEEASEALSDGISKKPPKEMKIRMNFLLGQVYQKMGLRYEASMAYAEVARLRPNDYEMYFKARLFRAKTFDVFMESSSKIYKELDELIKDEKNKEYLDQIYYAMAEVALEEEEYREAEDFLKLAIRNSTNNPEQKALAYLKIGDINFEFRDYVPAAAYYDSAVATLPPTHPDFREIQKRNNSLSRLVDNIEAVELQDSLQMMAGLSPEQQRAKIEDFIENQLAREEAKRRAAELKDLNARLAAANATTGPIAGGSQGWYFYNSGVRGNGRAAFVNYWGNRKLEDNWNQMSRGPAGSFGGPGSTPDGPVAEDPGAKPIAIVSAGKKAPPALNVESMMAQIPSNTFALDTSHLIVQQAMINQGQIYQLELNDNPKAVEVYELFLKRYPKVQSAPRVLFSLYRVYVDEGKEEKAEIVKAQLVNGFPESLYTRKIIDPGSISASDRAKVQITATYDKCYASFAAEKYRTTITLIDDHLANSSEEYMRAKFILLKGYSYGKRDQQEKMLIEFNTIVNEYPKTPEAALVASVLGQIDNPELVAPNEVFPYMYNAKEKHKYIIVFPNKGVNANQVRNKIADFNKEFYKFENLQVSNIFLDKQRQIMIVGSFNNTVKAGQYEGRIREKGKFWGNLPRKKIQVFIISESNLQKLYGTKDTDQYLRYYKLNYQNQP